MHHFSKGKEKKRRARESYNSSQRLIKVIDKQAKPFVLHALPDSISALGSV